MQIPTLYADMKSALQSSRSARPPDKKERSLSGGLPVLLGKCVSLSIWTVSAGVHRTPDGCLKQQISALAFLSSFLESLATTSVSEIPDMNLLQCFRLTRRHLLRKALLLLM